MIHIEYGEKNRRSPNNMSNSKYIYRKSDGARFTRQKDGKYTLDKSEMSEKYRYKYNALTGPSFVFSKNLIDKEDFYVYRGNDGHGDVD